MKRLLTLVAAFFAVCTAVHADTSYLLIQGPFGSGSTEETYKFQAVYPSGSLVTGQDLLNSILGTPVMTGSYSGDYGSYPEYTATKGNNGATYVFYAADGLGYYPLSFTMNGVTVNQDPSYDPAWNYYVAGGTGDNAVNGDEPGPYPNDGSWTFSNDGLDSRQIADDSFDGWVWGASGGNFEAPVTIAGTDNAPVASNFTSVPEPNSLALLLIGAAGVWTMMRRRR